MEVYPCFSNGVLYSVRVELKSMVQTKPDERFQEPLDLTTLSSSKEFKKKKKVVLT
jgi:hypothetical protein